MNATHVKAVPLQFWSASKSQDTRSADSVNWRATSRHLTVVFHAEEMLQNCGNYVNFSSLST